MIIIGSEIVEAFCKKHNTASSALEKWIKDVSLIEWSNHNELKKMYPSADYVGNKRYAFNIKGNNFRMIAVVIFIAEVVQIRFVGTHSEYDKISDIQNI